MSINNSNSTEYKGFKLTNRVVYQDVPIVKYSSTRTGLSVAVAQVEGPLVNCYATVATEAADHDGCPHVLEHLIFLGSEDYPYKGILDQLANRCLAQGTNAWTDVDHTCYTLTTAGTEGFKRLLPVYMDHILYPTLTDSGFYTEVHHINGEGEDAGVVYCEMQGCENTGSTKVYHTMMESLYDKSGYGFNTGGRVENLRSLTVEKVRTYHRSYYRPNNIRVIVTGKIEPEAVLDALSEIEEKILCKNISYNQERPWQSVLPAFTNSIEQLVEFPSNEEEGGAIVTIAWRLCPWNDFFTKAAIYILWSYLTDSAVSALQKEFVEIEDPLCGDVTFSLNDASECAHYITFKNVVTEKINSIKPAFFETLERIVEEGLDMKRMQSVIKQRRVRHLSGIEEDPHSTFSTDLITDFLYSSSESDLMESINSVKYIDMLADKSSEFWVKLIQEYILNKPNCTVLGKPSIALGEKIAKEEADRLKKQAEELGEEKLSELDGKLEEAEDQNNQPVSEELLKKYQIPDVSSISFVPVVTYRTDQEPQSEESVKLKQYLEKENSKPYPFFVQYDHILSEFVSITVLMDSGNLTDQQRQYLELYLEAVFEAPEEKDGKLLSHEDVVYLLEDQSVDHSNGCGLHGGNFTCGTFPQLLWLSLKFEKKDFDKMIDWTKDILWNSKFTAERLKISAKKLINDVARTKRSPNYVTRAALKFLNFTEQESNHISANSIRQHHFLSSVLDRLDTEPEVVIRELDEFRNLITDPKTLRIHITGNVYKQSAAKTLLVEQFIPSQLKYDVAANTVPKPFKFAQELLGARTNAGPNKGYIFSMASTDSGFLQQSCYGLKDFNSEKRAAMLVLIEYLCALEGPFWKRIRGAGLSYGYSIHQNVEEGLIYFALSQSGSVVKAYNEAKQILGKYLSKQESFEEVVVEAARSSVISEVIAGEETIHMAASNRLTQTLRGCPEQANKILLDRVSQVTIKDLYSILEEYLAKLFDISQGHLVIVTNPSKVNEIVQSLNESEGITLEEVGDVEQFFYKNK